MRPPGREYRVLPNRYEVRVQGALSSALAETFLPFETATERGGTVTVISGPVADQSDLSGLLQTVDMLGLVLIEVRPAEATD